MNEAKIRAWFSGTLSVFPGERLKLIKQIYILLKSTLLLFLEFLLGYNFLAAKYDAA